MVVLVVVEAAAAAAAATSAAVEEEEEEGEEASTLVEGWRERVTEAEEVAAADRSHVHGARNGVSRTTRSAITQVAPRTTLADERTSTFSESRQAQRTLARVSHVIDSVFYFRFDF